MVCDLNTQVASSRDVRRRVRGDEDVHLIVGNWKTSVQGVDIFLSLAQSGSNLTGSAKTNLGPDVFAVTGSFSDPNVSLQSDLDATTTLVFTGAFTDAITIGGHYTLGTLTGAATLTRT